MPQVRYMSISDAAKFLISARKGVDNVNNILLKMLEPKTENKPYELSLLLEDKNSARLYDEIRQAKDNSDSVLGKHFLRDLYRLLKYLQGDEKYADILNDIQDKKVAKSVKNAHMVNANPKESGPWIITDECDDEETFFKIYDDLVERVNPEILVQWWSVPNEKNEPYGPIIEKINKFSADREEKWNKDLGVKVTTKYDKTGIQVTKHARVQKLKIPDNYESIMQELARQANQPKEKTVEDLMQELEELKKQLANETKARQLAELNLANLRTKVLGIRKFGIGLKEAQDMAQKMPR